MSRGRWPRRCRIVEDARERRRRSRRGCVSACMLRSVADRLNFGEDVASDHRVLADRDLAELLVRDGSFRIAD